MDFSFGEEQERLRETVRRLLTSEFSIDYFRQADRANRFPIEVWRRMGELGWLGLGVEERYGGSAGDVMDMCLVVEELAHHGSAALAGSYQMQSSVVRCLSAYASDELKEAYLLETAKGERLWGFSLTEPSGGTDALDMSSTAVEEGDAWVLDGQKTFTSCADVADSLFVVVRTDFNPPKKSLGVSCYVVDTKTPGIEVRPMPKLGYHGANTCTVFYDKVRVPRRNLVGELHHGWIDLVKLLNTERILLAAVWTGVAAAAYDEALRYAKERHAFGRPIGQYQAIQHYVVDTATEVEMARLMTYKAAWLEKTGKPSGMESTMAKLVASETAARATDRGMRILAGYGYVDESDMQRYFRDARLGVFGAITNEMAKNYIGQSLGLPRSY